MQKTTDGPAHTRRTHPVSGQAFFGGSRGELRRGMQNPFPLKRCTVLLIPGDESDPFVTLLTSTDIRYVPGVIGILPPSTEAWSAGAGGDRYLQTVNASGGDAQVGVLRDDGDDRYLMIQNTNHPGATWPVDNTHSVTITLSFDFSAAPVGLDRSRLETLNKLNGQVESIPLTPLTPDAASLSVTLRAGDAIFVKYATGRPFALQ